MKIDAGCVPCAAKRKLLNQQYQVLSQIIKTRAQNEQRNYITYFDSEDEKFRAIPLDEAESRGVTIYEIITKH